MSIKIGDRVTATVGEEQKSVAGICGGLTTGERGGMVLIMTPLDDFSAENSRVKLCRRGVPFPGEWIGANAVRHDGRFL